MNHYIIDIKLFDDRIFAYGEPLQAKYNRENVRSCPECNRPLGMLKWLPPYKIKISKKNLGDFIWGSFVGCLVSEKFKKKYESAGFKGLGFFSKVELYYRNKLLEVEYFYPEISLIKAFVDMNRLNFDDLSLCNTCQRGKSILKRINGIVLDYFNSEILSVGVFKVNPHTSPRP